MADEGGRHAADRRLCNDYLGYLADRRYSPASVRAYAFDLLHFARWLDREGIGLEQVDTDALLRYLAACRAERREGQHDNVISLASGRASGFAPATINRRLAAISSLFASGRCVTRMRVARSVAGGRPGEPSAVSVPGCSRTRRSRSRGRSCGSVSRAGCRGGCRGRPRRCWAASVAGVTARSVG